MPCNYIDFLNNGRAIMFPAYSASNQSSSVWYTAMMTFINNMWTHYQSSGCGWWANRVTHWTGQLANNTYPIYQTNLKTAKIQFAQTMHTVCGCSGPVPMIVPTPMSTTIVPTPTSTTIGPRTSSPLASVLITSMNKITNIEIDQTTLPSSSTARTLKVGGDYDAVFTVEIKRSDGKYYDFTTSAFTSTYTSRNKLVNVKVRGGYRTNITFPASFAGTYTISIFAIPMFDTEFLIGNNKILYQITMEQVGDAIITFSGATRTLPIEGTPSLGTSTGTVIAKYLTNSRDVINLSTELATTLAVFDAGFLINDQPSDEDFYWSTTETVDGTTSSSTTVVVDDLSNLVVGMNLWYKTGTTLAETNTKISAINRKSKTLTLSVANSLTNNDTMTFRAYGSEIIRRAIGVGLEFSDLKIELVQLTNTLRTALSSTGTTATVKGTAGISVGATVRCRFLKEQETEGATIALVEQSITEGEITIENGTFDVANENTTIYIDGSSTNATLTGKIYIDKYPGTSQTIYLDLDNILTTGTAG